MFENDGWSLSNTMSQGKRIFWFEPDYWANFKSGFLSPNIVTIHHLKDLNQNVYPGFKNLFFAGVGYAVGGKYALSSSGIGWYVAKIPIVGNMALTRIDNEVKSKTAYQIGGMASSVLAKFTVMHCLGTLTRAVLSTRNPVACAAVVATIKAANGLNTAGGLAHVANAYNSIREQSLLKSFVQSAESVGKAELNTILTNYLNSPLPDFEGAMSFKE